VYISGVVGKALALFVACVASFNFYLILAIVI